MLKFEVDSLDNLDDSVKSLYEASGDKYRLKIEGLPKQEDVTGLKVKVQELLDEKKEEAKKRKAAEDAAEAARLETAKKSGDTESLEKSWSDKYAKRERELLAELEQYKGTVVKLTSGQTATKMASELAAVVNGVSMAGHLEYVIAPRLRTEYKDGNPTTIVLDKNGQPSAMTIDELKAEIKEDPSNAPLISGTKASGAGQYNQGGGGFSPIADIMKLNPVERMSAARAAQKK